MRRSRVCAVADLLQLDVSMCHGHVGSSSPGYKHSLHTLTALHCLVHYALQRNGLTASHRLVCCDHHTGRRWDTRIGRKGMYTLMRNEEGRKKQARSNKQQR